MSELMNVLENVGRVLERVLATRIVSEQRERGLVAPHVDVVQGFGPAPSQECFESAEVELHGSSVQLTLLDQRPKPYPSVLYLPSHGEASKADVRVGDIKTRAREPSRAAGEKMMMDMKASGVTEVVYFFYPHPPTGGWEIDDYTIPMLQDRCASLSDEKFQCRVVDSVPIFQGHDDWYALDGHPRQRHWRASDRRRGLETAEGRSRRSSRKQRMLQAVA